MKSHIRFRIWLSILLSVVKIFNVTGSMEEGTFSGHYDIYNYQYYATGTSKSYTAPSAIKLVVYYSENPTGSGGYSLAWIPGYAYITNANSNINLATVGVTKSTALSVSEYSKKVTFSLTNSNKTITLKHNGYAGGSTGYVYFRVFY